MTELEEKKALYEEKLFSYKNARNKDRKMILRKDLVLMWDEIETLIRNNERKKYASQ
jgi:hypothetical protein